MSSLFVAVGQDGLRIVSENGTDWARAQSGKEGETYRCCVFGSGRWVAAGSYGGDNISAATVDGTKWETAKKAANYVRYFRGLGHDGKQFIGIGGDPGSVGVSKPFYSTSVDGLTWSDFAEIGGKHIIRRLAFGKSLVVGVGDRGRRVVSIDYKEWKDAPEAKAIETLVDVAFGNGKFVGVGLHGLRMASEDGLVWSAKQTGDEGEHLNSVVWTGKQFVAIGVAASYFSADGVTWEKKANKDAPTNCCYGGGLFAGSGWKGRVLISQDAVTWREAHKNEKHIEAICCGGV
jgi:hypothetical protein